MNEFLELGRAFAEDERRKEQEKNANALAKMRIQALKSAAQSADDRSAGASEAVAQISPLVSLWQNQAAQMANETATANRRAASSEMMALQLLQSPASADPRSSTPIAGSMKDATEYYKNLMRVEVLGRRLRGEPVEPWMSQWTMPGVTTPEVEARQTMTKELQAESASKRTLFNQTIMSWQNEMDFIARQAMNADPLNRPDPDQIAEWRRNVTRRHITTLENLGLKVPSVMYELGEMFPPEPETTTKKPKAKLPPRHQILAERAAKSLGPLPKGALPRRYPRQEGEPVYEGREDIVYGEQPIEEKWAQVRRPDLREVYMKSLKQVFSAASDDALRELADEMIAHTPGLERQERIAGKKAVQRAERRKKPYLRETEFREKLQMLQRGEHPIEKRK